MGWLVGSMVVILIVLLLYTPVQIIVCAEHQKQWKNTVTVQVWSMRYQVFPAKGKHKKWQDNKTKNKRQTTETLQQISLNWQLVLQLIQRVLKSAYKYINLRWLQIDCQIGWNRADLTAYSYGAFWALMAMIPENWRKRSNVSYIPDFQKNHQEVYMKGIIQCRVGQLIGMVFSIGYITVQLVLEQRGKGQIYSAN